MNFRGAEKSWEEVDRWLGLTLLYGCLLIELFIITSLV